LEETLREREALDSLNNGSQLVQVNVMKYTPSFSAMALRTGMVEVTELNGLLCSVGRNVLCLRSWLLEVTLRKRELLEETLRERESFPGTEGTRGTLSDFRH
jgi:hypothetical protein